MIEGGEEGKKRGRTRTKCGCQKVFEDGTPHCRQCSAKKVGCAHPQGCPYCKGKGKGDGEESWKERSGNDAPLKVTVVEQLDETSLTTLRRVVRAEGRSLSQNLKGASEAFAAHAGSHRKQEIRPGPTLRSEAEMEAGLIRLRGAVGAAVKAANAKENQNKKSKIALWRKAYENQRLISDMQERLIVHRNKIRVSIETEKLREKVNEYIDKHNGIIDSLKEDLDEYNKSMDKELIRTRDEERVKYNDQVAVLLRVVRVRWVSWS